MDMAVGSFSTEKSSISLSSREELKSLGYVFRSQTDTEVILHLYDRFGESGFEKMNGMWAPIAHR